MARTRTPLAGALLVVAATACQSRSVVPVEVQSVEVRPSSFTLVEGESASAQAVPHGSGGEVLSGRSVTWSIAASGVATVDPGGNIQAVSTGLTTLRATVEGVTGSAPVTVLQGPTVHLSRDSVALTAIAGGDSGVESVTVTNEGNGVLSGLSVDVSYAAGGPSGWLTAGLSGTAAPAELSISADAATLAPEAYQAVVTVRSAAGRGSSGDVTVDLDVEAAPPLIVLDVQDVSFSGVVGGQVPAVQSIGITNGGGGVLGDLSTSITYQEAQSGWLRADLAAAEAPTQLALQASVGLLPAGTYHAAVAIGSSVASNSPQTLTVTFEVAAAGSSPPWAGGAGPSGSEASGDTVGGHDGTEGPR
jgi:hypothetical protein